MKQGQASSSGSGSRKIEPRSTAINPGGADNLGQAKGSHATDRGDFTPRITSLDAGRGYSAPGIGTTTHKCGSQGKH